MNTCGQTFEYFSMFGKFLSTFFDNANLPLNNIVVFINVYIDFKLQRQRAYSSNCEEYTLIVKRMPDFFALARFYKC